MPERVLGLAEGPRAPGHHPREGVSRLVQMNPADPRLPGVALQVLDEGPGGELRAGLPGAVVPGPQGLVFSQDMQPPAAPQIVEQGCVAKNMLGHKNTERHFSSGGNIEEISHESNLSANVAFPDSFNLALPNLVHDLIPSDGPPRRVETEEA